MNKKEIIIVNEYDKIIGHKERGTLNKEDIYRVSALWIQNSKGDILLAKRALTKSHNPGKWGPATAGTNDKGDTYDSNIVRETEEEIGLKGSNFKKTRKIRVKGEYNFFCQGYLTIIDKKLNEFIIQKEEVEEIKWFKKEELLKELEQNPDQFLKPIKECVN